MRKLNFLVLTGGISILFITLIPRISLAQTVADDSAVTREALVTGILVLSIIILVFLGLMLKARVNELQAFLRKDIQDIRPAKSWQKLMTLDEEELKSLIEKRVKHTSLNQTATATVK